MELACETPVVPPDVSRKSPNLEVSIPITHHFTHALAATLLLLIRGFKALVRLLRPILRMLARILNFVGRGLSHFVILPLYSAFLLAKIRFERTIASARGLVFFLFTHRYVSHVLLAIIAVTTLASQLTTKPASAQDAGEHSLLYTLVTRGQEDLIEEQMNPGYVLADVHYLSPDTIQSVPGIDYDYEPSPFAADLGIIGNIAVTPRAEFPDRPSEIDSIEPDTQTPDTTAPAAPVGRRGTETYVVRSGDTLATIARRYQVDVATIQWANNITRVNSLKPGDNLRIPPASGVLHMIKKGETVQQIAKSYKVDATVITTANNLSAKSSLSIGQELFIPNASPLAIARATPSPAQTTVAVRPDVPISRIKDKALDVYQELSNTKNDARNVPVSADTSGSKTKLLWPTHLRVINQYYGYSHTGIDIDGDYTDPIYASDDGVVEQAGWNNSGYGLMIFIDHGNGIKTRYAHSSKLYVKAGEQVKRGQVLGMVGTTGRSTGTHLHFEVYVNGKRANPLSYIR